MSESDELMITYAYYGMQHAVFYAMSYTSFLPCIISASQATIAQRISWVTLTKSLIAGECFHFTTNIHACSLFHFHKLFTNACCYHIRMLAQVASWSILQWNRWSTDIDGMVRPCKLYLIAPSHHSIRSSICWCRGRVDGWWRIQRRNRMICRRYTQYWL